MNTIHISTLSVCKAHKMRKTNMAFGDAVIVELRNVSLKQELNNVRQNIPKEWDIHVLHNNNLEIECQTCNYALLNIKTKISDGRAWYNKFLKKSQFWTMFKKEFVLLFEKDTVLCDNPTYPLNYFFQFNYIGAPWNRERGAGRYWCPKLNCCVGNSGLSLWNRTTMHRLTSQHAYMKNNMLVDYWISSELQRLQYPMPDVEYASYFSMEANNIFKDRIPIGMHFPAKHKKNINSCSASLRVVKNRSPYRTNSNCGSQC